MTNIYTKKLIIPTYPESPAESLPMFAETRVHQRSSGNPYPNAVVIKTRSRELVEREYTAVILENEYLELTILPELGGRIFRALDKRNGYDFFYKQSIIKPALIGALGSWISGGVEFNFPYHHRPSTFLPTDFVTETEPDGSVCVHLSEHDPFDRMKGMVTIRLRPGCTAFETAARIFNRTPERHSFLWWENAAAPVNEDYDIFFPEDVGRVYFHYRRNATTYPNATGHYNGHDFDGQDISRHKNTRFATSFFSDSSRFDFFGGYDHGKDCGVMHFADRHTSPGKKLFTWGYGQLSQSWEKALTDTDGAYAELMASSYSYNQPDFSWIEPYETKEFSQFWYPLKETGIPDHANHDLMLKLGDKVKIASTGCFAGLALTVKKDGSTVFETTFDITPEANFEFELPNGAAAADCEYTVKSGVVTLLNYKKATYEPLPETTIGDLPTLAECDNAEKAYLTGTHMLQYRDPKGSPDAYFKRALELDPGYTPALIALAECAVKRHDYKAALELLATAEERLLKLNRRPESGKLYYLEAICHERLKDSVTAYDRYFDSAVISDCVNRAYTRIALIDLKSGDFRAAKAHADYAIRRDGCNLTAQTALALANYRLGDTDAAKAGLEAILAADPLYHTANALLRLLFGADIRELIDSLCSCPTQTVIDICGDLSEAGFDTEANQLLAALIESGRADAPAYYLNAVEPELDKYPLGRTFPYRDCEREALEQLGSEDAKYLLGCLYYNERRYSDAQAIWEKLDKPEAKRGLAIAKWRNGERDAAVELLYSALEALPKSEQLLWELSGCLNRLGRFGEVVKLLGELDFVGMRDDLYLELVHAYNKLGDFAKARELLACHEFIPCEGGEPAVTSRYIEAMMGLAKAKYDSGDIEGALELYREGQIIPDNLGAGLWNDAPLMPLIYCEGDCMTRLGRDGSACFERVISMPVDFFSDGQLPLMPIWQVKALRALGRCAEADKLEADTLARFESALEVKDGGYFATTPFFNCYIDLPELARREHFEGLIKGAKAILEK